MSRNVKARVCLSSVLHNAFGKVYTFTPVTGPEGTENADWSKWTPSGEIRLQVTTEAFSDAKIGEEFEITFQSIQ